MTVLHNLSRLCTFHRLVHNRYCVTKSVRRVSTVVCTSPITIKNPNKGLNPSVGINFMRDCSSDFIKIPCGHCPECIGVRQLNFTQRVQVEALVNHIFFLTLTYNNESLPYVQDHLVDPRSGDCVELDLDRPVRYADFRDFSLMMMRLRNSGAVPADTRFVTVSELGSSRGRPHFHSLLFIPKSPGDDFNKCLELEHSLFSAVLSEWRRNYGSRRVPVYRPLCTYVRRFVRGELRTNFDLHYVNPCLTDGSEGDVAFYVSKYMVKPSDRVRRLQSYLRLNLDEEQYKSVWQVVRPRYSASHLFGLSGFYDSSKDGNFRFSPKKECLDYIRDCVLYSRSNFDSPHFVNPVDGSCFPLSRFYLNRLDCVSIDDWRFFWQKQVSSGRRIDNLTIDERSRNALLNSIDLWNHKMSNFNFDSDDLDDLF